MAFDITYRYLIDPDEVREALAAFANQPVIGLDTETFHDYSTKQNRLSLLQLAAPTGEVVVIDALSAGIDRVRPLIEDPRAMMAAHNARFDDGVLRGAGFEVAGLVDTLRLARKTLKLQSFSLASVSDYLLGLPLDKTQQRSDWRRRPLSRIQLDYAALDARIALHVFQELAARLQREGRWEVELRRARVFPKEGPKEGPKEEARENPSPKRATIQLRPLTAEERQLAASLQRWRQEKAKAARLPLYMICLDKTIEHLAIERPCTLEALAGIYGLGPARIAKYGAELLERMK
ncbi:MAG: HRDC domain-containing protein [Blastocatellia bacterium]